MSNHADGAVEYQDGQEFQQPGDEELLLRYRNSDDQGAFDRLVHRYERPLYNYLRHFLGKADLAEDVFQATFLQLHRKKHLYQPGRRVRPWLYSIATHLAIDLLRKAKRQSTVSLDLQQGPDDFDSDHARSLIDLLESSTPSPLTLAEEHELSERTREAVNKLPEFQRAVVLLVFFQGLKYSEVAEIIGVPLGTVKSRLHAALAKLHETWRYGKSG